MEGFNPAWFGERIEEERNTRGWKLQELQARLARQTGGARGTSYGAVWSYVSGKAPADPRREVIEGFAALFGVRPEYLMRPGEARTPADLTAAQRADAAIAPERAEPEARVFREALNPGPAAEAMLWRLWAPLFWKSIEGTEGEDQDAIGVECAERIMDAILAPLEVLDAMPPRMVKPGQVVAGSPDARRARMWGYHLDEYIIAVCQALGAVVQRQADARDVEESNADTPKQED